MHFTALSIKMANETPTSLCALEIVIVKQGRIIEQKNWFFRPAEMRFEPVQIKRYAVFPRDVIDASDFSSQWMEIKSYLENEAIICHQAIHVWSTLCQILDYFNLPYPNCQLICTMMLARCAYPDLHSRKLSELCSYLKLDYNPLDSGGSASACTQLFLRLAKVYYASDCEEVLQALSCYWGKIIDNQMTLPSFDTSSLLDSQVLSVSSSAFLGINNKATPSLNQDSGPIDLKGQVVCLTGSLESMTRVQAVKHLNGLNAFYSSSVTSKTTLVITNIKHPEELPREQLTSKLRRALILIEEGHPITIIDESTFLKLI